MGLPRIELVCIGSELLSHRVNTHAVSIGEELNKSGFSIAREHTVSDDAALMAEVFRDALKKANVLIVTGGLGPTFDDITREVLGKVLKTPLQFQPVIVNEIKRKFKSRKLKMPPHNRRQGFILKGAKVLNNRFGTAPGQMVVYKNKIIFVLPGPANEMLPLLKESVIPYIKNQYQKNYLIKKSFQIFGIAESVIDEKIRPIVEKYKKFNTCTIIHGILASQFIITVKFEVQGKDPNKVAQVFNMLEQQYRKKISLYTFGEDGASLPQVVGQLLLKLRKKISIAESCTGGLISKILTDQPGSSAYFTEGRITYSNESKSSGLGVKASLINKYGAVSEPVAKAMATGLLKKSKSDFSISTTGIAGPGGGIEGKPVGLVYIGVASPRRTTVFKFNFRGNRQEVRERSAAWAFELLRKELIV